MFSQSHHQPPECRLMNACVFEPRAAGKCPYQGSGLDSEHHQSLAEVFQNSADDPTSGKPPCTKDGRVHCNVMPLFVFRLEAVRRSRLHEAMCVHIFPSLLLFNSATSLSLFSCCNCRCLKLVSTRFWRIWFFLRFPVSLLLPWCSMLVTIRHTVFW